MNTELQKILEAYNNKLIELKYQKAISLLNLITDEDYLKLMEDNKDLFEPISQENGDQYLHREDVLDKINETFIQYINNPDPNKMNEDELKQYIESSIVNLDEKQLNLKTIEFGHYQTYPYDIPKPRLIIDFNKKRIEGYIDKDLSDNDETIILDLLEKYHVYNWIFDEYHNKSNTRDPDDLEGYDWYLEFVFEDNIIWHLFGYNDYPDTYVGLAREVEKITRMDLLELNTISDEDLILFDKFGNMCMFGG